jgi:RecA-family ATPase
MPKNLDKNLSQLAEKYESVVPLRHDKELESIKSISASELSSLKPSPLEYVLYPWLPTQGIAFIYAATGVGKTLFSMNVGYAIAGGGNFLKYRSPRPRKVLYIDGEMAFNQVHSRFMDIVAQQGPLYDENMFNLLTPDKILPFRLPKICDPLGQSFYNEFIKRESIEVLIIDNLSMLSSIDENNSEQWKIVQDWLISLRSSGISIIMVHHAGKDKFGYRGTSRMLDCADTAISLQTLADDKLENENLNIKKFKVVYQKARSFGGSDSLPLEISLSPEGWGFQAIEQTNLDMVIERMNMKMSQKDISVELKYSRPYINKLVQKARKMGLIRD